MADVDEFRHSPALKVVGRLCGIAVIEDPRINARLRVCVRCEGLLDLGGTVALEPPHQRVEARVGICRACRVLYVLAQ